MKKYLSILIAAVLCACCLALAACGGSSGSSGAASSDSSGSASLEASDTASSESAESPSAAVDPSEKFLGDWKLAGFEFQGITAIGDMSSLGVGDASLSINADGTGKMSMDDLEGSFTWEQAGDDALSIKIQEASDDSPINGTLDVLSRDDTVSVTITSDGEEGTLIFSKDGTITEITPLSMDNAADITSEDALVGTWEISGVSMSGATMYGDAASLAAMNGSEEMVIEFKADGTVTLFGSEASWSVDDSGAVISEGGVDIPVKLIGDDIVIDIGEIFGMDMLMSFSK